MDAHTREHYLKLLKAQNIHSIADIQLFPIQWYYCMALLNTSSNLEMMKLYGKIELECMRQYKISFKDRVDQINKNRKISWYRFINEMFSFVYSTYGIPFWYVTANMDLDKMLENYPKLIGMASIGKFKEDKQFEAELSHHNDVVSFFEKYLNRGIL